MTRKLITALATATLCFHGEAAVAANPSAYPMRLGGIIILYGETIPPYDGYGPDDAVLEVLVNVGIAVDPDAWWVHPSQNPSSDYYVVTLTTDPSPAASRQPPGPGMPK